MDYNLPSFGYDGYGPPLLERAGYAPPVYGYDGYGDIADGYDGYVNIRYGYDAYGYAEDIARVPLAEYFNCRNSNYCWPMR